VSEKLIACIMVEHFITTTVLLPTVAFQNDWFGLDVDDNVIIEKVNFIDFDFAVLHYQVSHHRR
jgi:hypothetical protein